MFLNVWESIIEEIEEITLSTLLHSSWKKGYVSMTFYQTMQLGCELNYV